MLNWPKPMTVKKLREFLGLTEYYKKFVKGYGVTGKPLTNRSISAAQKGNDCCSKPIVLEYDASDKGIGAMLMQDGMPLAFLS